MKRKYVYANDYQEIYPGNSLTEIASLIVSQGVDNKLVKIRCNCSVCDLELDIIPSVFKKQKSFRCDEHKKKSPSGEDSKFYKRVDALCSNCGKNISIKPYKTKRKNKFGDSHHFCTQKCYWKYRSVYYVGNKGAMYNYKFTDEQLLALGRRTAEMAKSRSRFNTKIQLSVNEILDGLNIKYEREYTLDYYSCDIFLTEANLVIEVMGDYYHGSPLRYNENKYLLNEIQCKTILKDKQKRGYIKNKYGYNILFLWENDINKDSEKCILLIQHYISNKGIVNNYHSFNYSVLNNNLYLNSNLIIPYQDMSSNEYKHLQK